jgi:hypothetical protein
LLCAYVCVCENNTFGSFLHAPHEVSFYVLYCCTWSETLINYFELNRIESNRHRVRRNKIRSQPSDFNIKGTVTGVECI